MAQQEVSVALRLRNARLFNSQARESAAALGTVGTAAKKNVAAGATLASRATGTFGRVAKSARSHAWNLAKGVGRMTASYGGLAAILGGGLFLKDAIDKTRDLMLTTRTLVFLTKMHTSEASRWAAVAQVWGVNARTLAMGFRALSGSITQARKGSVGARGALGRLHLTWKDLQRADPTKRILLLADAFKNYDKGASRAQDIQKLFGRGAAAMAPLLGKGSKEIQKQLKWADKYGVTLHGNATKRLNEFIDAQHRNEMATLGLELALGQKLIPWLTKAINWFSNFTNQMRTGKGAAGDIRDAIENIANAIRIAWPYFRIFLGIVIKVWGWWMKLNLLLLKAEIFIGEKLVKGFRLFWGAVKGPIMRVGHFLNQYIVSPLKWVLEHLGLWHPVHAVMTNRGAQWQGLHSGATATRRYMQSHHGHIPPPGWLAGRRAAGGDVSAGLPYRVGERGPETFVPDRSGTIVPHGGVPVHVQVHLDRKVLIDAVATGFADERARR